jgi:hypothetical protein
MKRNLLLLLLLILCGVFGHLKAAAFTRDAAARPVDDTAAVIAAESAAKDADDTAAKAAWLKAFFTKYAETVACDDTSKPVEWFKETLDSLIDHSIDPAFLPKLEAAEEEADCDLIIRAQDFTKESLPTIEVRHAEGDRFIVSYMPTDVRVREEIPMSVMHKDGRFVISDIELDYTTEPQTPEALLITFYSHYCSQINAWAETPHESNKKFILHNIIELMTEYMTSEAIKQFSALRVKSGINDPLLDGPWPISRQAIDSFSVEHLGGDRYTLSYQTAEGRKSVTLQVAEVDGRLMITGLER